MSRHRLEIVIVVDDEALAEHDGDDLLPPNEVDDWTRVADLEAAMRLGIVDVEASEIVDYTAILDPPPPPDLSEFKGSDPRVKPRPKGKK